MHIFAELIAVTAGALVGFSLGLLGSGSIIAMPALLYLVGLPPHAAIGTSALAVSANAYINFAGHARARNVHWGSAAIFAVTGVVGAVIGSTIGKAVDGHRLVLLFALLMVVIGGLMLRPRAGSTQTGLAQVKTKAIALKTAAIALGVGLLSGFFGIGGGFLIVPGLIFATGMPMVSAIGTSLLSVGTFGLATALNYAASGLVDWRVAAEFIGGGIVGGWLGMKLALRLAKQRNTLTRLFAALILGIACYMIWRSV